MQLQPSEIMKIALVLALARYFHSVSAEDVGRLRYLDRAGADGRSSPSLLVLKQPDLGTAMMLAGCRRRAVLPRRRAAVDVRGRER